LQRQIIAEVEKTERVRDLANAWNYLSSLLHQVAAYPEAEQAARRALEIYKDEHSPTAEVLGCYEFMLAQILAAQGRFDEAAAMAEAGVSHYAVFHDPEDEFLKARRDEAASMRESMNRESRPGGAGG